MLAHRGAHNAGLVRARRAARRHVSHANHADVPIERPKIVGVSRGYGLIGSSSANHDMRVHDVCGAACREESADTRRVNPAKGDDIGGRLAD